MHHRSEGELAGGKVGYGDRLGPIAGGLLPGGVAVIVPAIAPAELYGTPDGSGAGAGIDAFGLLIRIEVGQWDTVISASPVADDGWCGVPLDDRLPDLVRALTLMIELRAGSDVSHLRRTSVT